MQECALDESIPDAMESEARFRAISSSATDAIAVMDSEGKVSFWNPAAESMFGYKSDEVLGKNMFELVVPERFSELLLEWFRRLRETEQVTTIEKIRSLSVSSLELTCTRKDGPEFPVEL